MNSDIFKKVNSLREKLSSSNIEGFLIPSNDEFQSEYVPEHLNRLKYITGFSGSNGIAVITKNQALFFTDGRYILQAQQELGSIYTVYLISDIFKYFPVEKIGYDPKLHSIYNMDRYKKFNLIATDNLVDLVWEQKDQYIESKVFLYPIKYAGETSLSKISKLKAYLKENKTDALIITDSTSICWLLNIRAHDVDYNPILLSYLIISKEGDIELFSNASNIKNVRCYNFSQFSNRLKLLEGKKIQIDPKSASIWIKNHLTNPILKEDPCLIAKACKNKVEINQSRRIHIIDGVAVSKLLCSLEKKYIGKTELSVIDELLKLRSSHSDFIYPSFDTISAFADHGAIIHYRATDLSNKPLIADGLFLLDSGGQYFGATTDITRVIPIGKASYQQKIDFTLVLKGHIALANSKFIPGTTGADLDVLARYHLWKHGKDYAHGTGHGVGNCLGVHEGPQGISKYNNCQLKPGMIISNEPGYYKNGEYGIRIESLMLVKQDKNRFLYMETLSLAPIERRLILVKLLTQDERKWLNEYHKKVYLKLSPHLNSQEKIWLRTKTKAI